MNKQEILNILKNLNINKQKYIVISGAALVLYNIVDNTSDIDLATTTEEYNNIDWNTKQGAFGKEIKYNNCIEISDNLYNKAKTTCINGYNVATIDFILEVKKKLNREKDRDVILKLEKIMEEERRREGKR